MYTWSPNTFELVLSNVFIEMILIFFPLKGKHVFNSTDHGASNQMYFDKIRKNVQINKSWHSQIYVYF